MKHSFKNTLCLCILLICSQLSASHNRSGEITYKRIAPFTQGGIPVYTYSITVVKYMNDDGGSMVPDRCADTVYFGDGTKGTAYRINGLSANCGCPVINNVSVPCGSLIVTDQNYQVKQSIYTVTHTYSGAGTYVLKSSDPKRTAGIYNIPNSDQVAFYLEALLIINNESAINASPILTNPPIYRAGYQVCYYYDLMAVDADGDSLAYEIVPCRGQSGQAIPGFSQPAAGVNGTFNINNYGVLTWCAPQIIGMFSTAIEIREYRKVNGVYQLIGKILRDMEIIVNAQAGPPSPIGPNEIKENDLSEITSIYPNPFTNKLSFDLKINVNGPVEISLYSNDGKLVFKQLIKNANGTQEISPNTLEPGLYTVAIKTNTGIIYRKVVKQ